MVVEFGPDGGRHRAIQVDAATAHIQSPRNTIVAGLGQAVEGDDCFVGEACRRRADLECARDVDVVRGQVDVASCKPQRAFDAQPGQRWGARVQREHHPCGDHHFRACGWHLATPGCRVRPDQRAVARRHRARPSGRVRNRPNSCLAGCGESGIRLCEAAAGGDADACAKKYAEHARCGGKLPKGHHLAIRSRGGEGFAPSEAKWVRFSVPVPRWLGCNG